MLGSWGRDAGGGGTDDEPSALAAVTASLAAVRDAREGKLTVKRRRTRGSAPGRACTPALLRPRAEKEEV